MQIGLLSVPNSVELLPTFSGMRSGHISARPGGRSRSRWLRLPKLGRLSELECTNAIFSGLLQLAPFPRRLRYEASAEPGGWREGGLRGVAGGVAGGMAGVARLDLVQMGVRVNVGYAWAP